MTIIEEIKKRRNKIDANLRVIVPSNDLVKLVRSDVPWLIERLEDTEKELTETKERLKSAREDN